jgi:hypothetical protein
MKIYKAGWNPLMGIDLVSVQVKDAHHVLIQDMEYKP